MFKRMLCATVLGLSCAAASAAPGEIAYKALNNGIGIVVIPDDRAPVAVLEVVYRVGGFAETRPVTGISHVLEHMMFQGTGRYPEDTFSQTLAKMGAVYNAFTADDMTAYYQMAEVTELETLFALEADRAVNLTLAEANFTKEIEVVKEERRMRVDDVPQRVAEERMISAAFPAGPYHDPLVGWMDDLNHMSVNDVRQWYEAWYRPENMVVLVAGDVQPKQVFRLAEKYFGRLSPKAGPAPHIPAEVPPLGGMRLEAAVSAQVPQLLVGYHVPSLVSAQEPEEVYALAVAMDVLDGGLSARFEKHLVRDQEVASSIWSMVDERARFDTLALFGGTPTVGQTPEGLEKAIVSEIQALKKDKVSREELHLAKMRLKARHTFAQDSLMEFTNFYASFEGAGLGWEVAESYMDNIEAVTAEQVQTVIEKYFIPERQIVTYIYPREAEA